jgi:predicted amidohydrolase
VIVAGLQMDVAWEDPPANFERAARLAERAVGAGAELLVLPEMFATGFSMAADRTSAWAGETRAALAALASRHGVWVLGGYADPGETRPRNACSLFRPDGGEALCYHKLHPFTLAGEDLHYDAGEQVFTVPVAGLAVTPLICYDLRFPEPFRAAAEATDLFVVIASWPAPRREAWRTLLAARAIENQAFVLGVNRVGEGDGLSYRGDSMLVDPFGRVLASAAEQEAVLVGEVDAAAVSEARERFSFRADPRPAVYDRLGAEGEGRAADGRETAAWASVSTPS